MLLLDTYEAAAALDDWLRERFLPELPAAALVVIAGRAAPGAAWRRDPGWHDLLRVVSLRNLRPEDARRCCARTGVAEEHARTLELTHGHPLALSLLVDVLAQRRRPGVGAAELARGPGRRAGAAGALPRRRAERAPPAGAEASPRTPA